MHKYWKIFLVMLLVVGMMALTAACGQKPTSQGEKKDTTAQNTPPKKEDITLGLIVKNAQEFWFQNVIKGAENEADKLGIKMVSLDGRGDPSVFLNAVDQAIQQKVKGLIVVVPDQKISPAVVEKAKQAGIPIMSQSDVLIDTSGKQLAPHLGIDDEEYGKAMGEWLAKYVQNQGWLNDPKKVVRAVAMSYEQVSVLKKRTDGAKKALLNAGFKEDMIINAALKKYGMQDAYDAMAAVITAHPEVTNWVVFGFNDESVVAAVRALEAVKKDKDAVACGLDGSHAKDEFSKSEPTAFKATVYLSAQDYSAKSVQLMYDNIVNKKEIPWVTNWPPTIATRDNWQQVVKEK
ncbi:substrate-binding domain-containing protein [Moorella naiadis]|uniref:substrate-binding domain-containing protein n=1 Tax=Moorella naiadis (nom. illeg.) TaxID=3093670 RepID=UPI003D9C9556